MAPDSRAASMTVATEASAAGTWLFNISASSSIYDPFKGNNFAAVKIEVDQPCWHPAYLSN